MTEDYHANIGCPTLASTYIIHTRPDHPTFARIVERLRAGLQSWPDGYPVLWPRPVQGDAPTSSIPFLPPVKSTSEFENLVLECKQTMAGQDLRVCVCVCVCEREARLHNRVAFISSDEVPWKGICHKIMCPTSSMQVTSKLSPGHLTLE